VYIRKHIFRAPSQRQFSKMVGVSQPTVNRWEAGIGPSQSAMEKIRAAAVDRGLPWDDRLFFEAPAGPDTAEVL
jgi:transcriptional regulator with XRE-family HTH domain